ncbi:MAG: hypothetical protein QF570_09090 [Myxococcota bacterium]|jgi:hypothetical protein|nr:hypothetical protein [Myxococcota bacterium]
MTMRSEHDQRIREFKTALLGRVARLAMTTRKTGLDGLVKSLLAKQAGDSTAPDPDLEHPADWDRPID